VPPVAVERRVRDAVHGDDRLQVAEFEATPRE